MSDSEDEYPSPTMSEESWSSGANSEDGSITTPSSIGPRCLDVQEDSNGPAAPIEKLPIELLQKVFLYSLPLLPHPYCLPEIMADFEEPDPDAEHINLARLRLTYVCRAWRSIVLSSTQLWTMIAIDRPFPKDIRVVEEWFNNSGTRPLDISFDSNLLFKHPCEAAGVTGILHHNMSRIRCFLTMYDILRPAILQDLFPPGRVIEAPLLEALRLCCGYIHGPIGRINAPSLIHFHKNAIADTHLVLTPTPSLRSYAGSGTSMSLITQCPNITELHIYLDQYILRYEMDKIVLPAVQTLSLVPHGGLSNSYILRFVAHVDVPSLTSLEVWMNDSNDTVTCGRLLGAIAERYGPNIRHLEIGCGHFNRCVAKDIFFGIPRLKTLAFTSSTLRECVSDALTPRPAADSALVSWPCPELSELKITDCIVSPCFGLVRLIRRRTTSTYVVSQPPRYLTLFVNGCRGTNGDIAELEILAETRNFILHHPPQESFCWPDLFFPSGSRLRHQDENF